MVMLMLMMQEYMYSVQIPLYEHVQLHITSGKLKLYQLQSLKLVLMKVGK